MSVPEPIVFTIRKSRRARHARLAIHPDGRVVVTLPWRVPKEIAIPFVRSHASWIREKQKKQAARSSLMKPLGGMGGYREHKDSAMRFVLDRLAHFNAVYGFTYHRVCIRDNSSRWGSCSKKGNLNFHYKIIFLPQELADYLVVHELCHLKEFNHLPRYWKLVAQTVPEYKNCRKEMRRFVLK